MDDLRDKILWGYYDNTATNVPVTGYGVFACLGRIQMARTGGGSTYYRSKYDTETLGPWRKIYDSNILTDSSELSSLASALGIPDIFNATESIADCNVAPLGVSVIQPVTLNSPVVANMTLVTFGNTSSHRLQLCLRATGTMYYRGYSGGSWSAWKEVQMV